MNRNTDKNANERFDAAMAEIAKTRELDRLDVRSGRISPLALSWFTREYVQSLTLIFPEVTENMFSKHE